MSVISDFVDVIDTRLSSVVGVSVIVPTRQAGDAFGDKTVTVKTKDVERLEEYDRPGNPPAVGKLLPVMITGTVIPSELAVTPTPFHEAAADLGTDLQNSITSPVNWHTFGGNSIDASVGELKFIEPDDESPGAVQFMIEIKYRVDETNHNTLRA